MIGVRYERTAALLDNSSAKARAHSQKPGDPPLTHDQGDDISSR